MGDPSVKIAERKSRLYWRLYNSLSIDHTHHRLQVVALGGGGGGGAGRVRGRQYNAISRDHIQQIPAVCQGEETAQFCQYIDHTHIHQRLQVVRGM